MSVQATRVTEGSYFGSVITIGVLFFIFGFVTWLNGPMITFVKLAFTLDDVNAFLVPMAFYLSYFFLALPSSAVLRRTGMKKGMALGLLVMAIGATMFGEFTRNAPVSGCVDRPVRDRRRIVIVADGLQSLHQHHRADR